MNIACWIWACCTHFILQNKLTLFFFLCEVLGVFLWPLISSHDISSWLEPVLQKLDFGIGEFFQKIKENHGKYHAICFYSLSKQGHEIRKWLTMCFFLRQLPAKLLQTYMTFIFLLCRPNQNKSLKTLTEVLLQLVKVSFGICNMSHISQQHITSIM